MADVSIVQDVTKIGPGFHLRNGIDAAWADGFVIARHNNVHLYNGRYRILHQGSDEPKP